MIEALPCLCGQYPVVKPLDFELDGNAWGEVRCVNDCCPAKPGINDGETLADDRGSDVYKALAINRWNHWISGDWKSGEYE